MCGILFAIALMLLIWDIQLKNNTVNNSGENFTFYSIPREIIKATNSITLGDKWEQFIVSLT